MNNNIDFDSALYAINQDGSYLHQQDGLWGLFDHGESLDNPVVLYTFRSQEELILWYFNDMGWDIHQQDAPTLLSTLVFFSLLSNSISFLLLWAVG